MTDEKSSTGELRERVDALEQIVRELASKKDLDAHFERITERIAEIEKRVDSHDNEHKKQMSDINLQIRSAIDGIPTAINGSIDRMMSGYTVTVNRMDIDINALQAAVNDINRLVAVLSQRFDDHLTRTEMIAAAQASTDRKLSDSLDRLSQIVTSNSDWIAERSAWERRVVRTLSAIRHAPNWLRLLLTLAGVGGGIAFVLEMLR